MTTISNVGKIAYVYDESSETWHPVAGMVDASADFSWTGDHTFSSAATVTSAAPVVGSKGINAFTSVSDRTTKIPSPVNGAFAFVPVNNVMELQYYYAGHWRVFTDNAFLSEKLASFTLATTDVGRTIEANSSSSLSITVPLDSVINFTIGTQIAVIQSGTGQVTFVAGTDGTDTVALLSKNSNKKTASRYSQAILVKKAANAWYLMGDLTA